MAKIVAQGQITIVDMHDMPPVQGRLTSNLPKMVVLSSNGGSQSPDWAAQNLIVKAEIYQAGNASDLVAADSPLIKGITWYTTLGSSAETSTLPGGVTPSKEGNTRFNNKLTINQRLLSTSNPALKIRAVVQFQYQGIVQEVPISIEIDFALANNGTPGLDSYSVFLSNGSWTFPTNESGSTTQAWSTTTRAIAYKGTALLAPTLSTTAVAGLPSGMTLVQNGADGLTINVAAGTNLGAADSGSVTLRATVDSKNFDLVFTWAKSKQGNSSTSYWGVVTPAALVKKWNGTQWVYDPATVTVSAKSQTGTSAAVAYNTRFRLISYNGGTEVSNVVSTVDEANKSLTIAPNSTVTHVKTFVYAAGGTATVLDEQEIRVVEESKKNVTVSVYAESDTIRNSTGTAVLKVLVFRDGQDITATASKQWFKDINAISGQTGTSLTVTGADVATSQMYQCKVTVDGSVYIDAIVIYDANDPIQLSVTSSNGEVFKNGVGTSDLSCLLWRNAERLDDSGNLFMYCWHKIKNDGSEDVNWSPTAKVTPVSTNKSPQIAALTAASSGASIVLDDVTYIRKGYTLFLGNVTTPYAVASVTPGTAPAGTVTLTVAPAATASGTAVYTANYKVITVTSAEINEKETFMCELVQ